MTPEERELLRRSVSLGEDNHLMLRSIRRSMHVSSILSLVYWIVILGSAVGAYYYIQPHIDEIMSIYNGAKDNLNTLNSSLKGVKK